MLLFCSSQKINKRTELKRLPRKEATKMKMNEPGDGANIEKLRQDAERKMKTMRRILPACLILFAALAAADKWYFFVWLGELGWGNPSVRGAFYGLLANLIMAVMASGVAYIFYGKLVWQRAYNRFNFSFKNMYVLDSLRGTAGFSKLRYNAAGGFSYEEIYRMKLVPTGSKKFYQSSDELTGLLDGARFRCGNVMTAEPPKGRRALPDVLFEGQVVVFSYFDERKISDGFVQVFSKKVLAQVKRSAAPLKIQTENGLFNENFAVFAENEHNAFYILTPPVLERITAFCEAMDGEVYLAFDGPALYVTCSQMRSPFDAYVDVPVEEQRRRIEKDAEILRRAREILITAAADGRA